LLLCVALLVSACGPSGSQIRTAKSAEYKLSGKQMLDVALQVTQRTYKIGPLEIDRLTFGTAPQFYTAEGSRISPTREFAGDFVNADGGDVRLQLIVKVVDTGPGRVAVTVTPRTFQLISGSPQPRELTPDDPYLPPWVLGRVNTLALAIYEAGKPYLDKP
jgi:hypothetical protein